MFDELMNEWEIHVSWIVSEDFVTEVGHEHTIKSGEVSGYGVQRGK